MPQMKGFFSTLLRRESHRPGSLPAGLAPEPSAFLTGGAVGSTGGKPRSSGLSLRLGVEDHELRFRRAQHGGSSYGRERSCYGREGTGVQVCAKC